MKFIIIKNGDEPLKGDKQKDRIRFRHGDIIDIVDKQPNVYTYNFEQIGVNVSWFEDELTNEQIKCLTMPNAEPILLPQDKAYSNFRRRRDFKIDIPRDFKNYSRQFHRKDIVQKIDLVPL